MLFKFLKHTLRVEAGVGIVESGDEAERDNVVFAALAFRTVDPRTTVFLCGERPAQGVDHFARSNAARRNFPKFFNASAVSLRVGVFAQPDFRTQLFTYPSAPPFA